VVSATITSSYIEQVGSTAGEVWQTLKETGPLSISKLPKQVEAPRDMVMMAVGWLAREDKIAIEEQGRSRIVSLQED